MPDRNPAHTLNRKKNGFIPHEKFDSVPDEQLINQILDGNTELFEIIVRRYNQQLFRIIRSYLSDEEKAKDVLQSTYIRAYENLGQFRGEARFSTWLTRIAINQSLKAINRDKRQPEKHDMSGNGNRYASPLSSEQDPESKTVNNDMKQLIKEAVDTLPPKYRSVFVMREIEQMSTRETAECLEITRSNVKVRLHRSKKMLRDQLESLVTESEIFDFKGKRCDRMVRRVMKAIGTPVPG